MRVSEREQPVDNARKQTLPKQCQTDSKTIHELPGEFLEAAQESGFHVTSEHVQLDLVPQRQEAPRHEPYIIHRLCRGDEETKV